MRSLRSSAFFDSLRKNGGIKIGAVIILGAILLILAVSGNSDSVAEEKEDTESRLCELCSSIEGVGECRVMVTYVKQNSGFGSNSTQRVDGVTVLCRGADSVKTRQRLTDVICSLFDIGANRVRIEKLE